MADPLRIALLSYSTKPRGGVVHTLALAEALAAAGQDVTVWTLGRGGDSAFFRPVDPRVRQLAGREMAARYTWPAAAAAHLKFYRALLARTAVSP